MKQLLSLITALVVLATLTGCETSQGFGRDVQDLGEEIEDI